MQTCLHVRPPRLNCLSHEVKQMGSEFGENSLELSFHLESFVIRVAQEGSIETTAPRCGLSGDQSWGVLERAVNRGQGR